jgi:hypothetical protein
MAWHCVSNRRHFGSKCRTRHLACAIRDQPRENRGHENHRDRYTVRHLVYLSSVLTRRFVFRHRFEFARAKFLLMTALHIKL